METKELKLTPTQREVLNAHKLGRTPMAHNTPMIPLVVHKATKALVEMGLMPRLAAPPLRETDKEAIEAQGKPVQPRKKKEVPPCPVTPLPDHKGLSFQLIIDPRTMRTVGVTFLENPPQNTEIGDHYHIYSLDNRYLGFTLSPSTALPRILRARR
jgi:hypothetical protein